MDALAQVAHERAACGHTLTARYVPAHANLPQTCAARRRSQPLVTEYMQAKSEAQTLAREVAEWQRKLGVTEKVESATSTWATFDRAAGSLGEAPALP